MELHEVAVALRHLGSRVNPGMTTVMASRVNEELAELADEVEALAVADVDEVEEEDLPSEEDESGEDEAESEV